MESLIGQTIGTYEILAEVGRGGMAVVYKAYQRALDRYVAIKVLPPQFTFDPEFVRRFALEARAAAKLKHPNIVTIHDVGEQNGIHYIVEEFVEGITLADLIRREGALPPARAANIIAQVASALDYAHALGFIHRDVKPSNIMIGANDHATLTDFGIAKAAEGTRVTKSGVMVGTPEYMAPEQIRGQAVDGRVDVYALGVVGYEMLAGRVPFQGDTARILHAHVYEAPPPLRSLNPRVPAAAEVALGMALAKEPAQRYARAGDFANALTAAVSGGMAVSPPEAPTRYVPPPPPPPRQTSAPLFPVLAGIAGAVVVLLCVVLAIALMARQPNSVALAPTSTTVASASPTAVPTAAAVAVPTARPTVAPTATPLVIVVTATPIPTPTATTTPQFPVISPQNADQIRELATLSGHTWDVVSVAFSPDGRTLASGSYDATIKLWDVASGREVRTLSGHTWDVLSVAFAPDGRTLASGSSDKTIKLWDVASGREVRTLSGHTRGVLSVAFAPDGRTLASGSWQEIKLWDVASGGEVRTLSGHTWDVVSVAFAPDGRTLASGSDDNTIKLWDVASGREVRTLSGHTGSVLSVAFAPDGRTLASGSWQEIKLWDVASGRAVRTLSGHRGWSVAFAPDGRTLASGSWQEIKLWDVSSGREVQTLRGHTGDVKSVAFAPDGRMLASGSTDGSVRLWGIR